MLHFDLDIIFFAFLLTILAWAATSLWAFIAFFVKKDSNTLLSFWLWFSAWVMIYLSFMEIIPESEKFFYDYFSSEIISWLMVLLFLAFWIILTLSIDYILPENFNPDDPKDPKLFCDLKDKEIIIRKSWLMKVWVLTAAALALHNFPEWLATFVSALVSIEVWIAIAVALALHNIPEWMAVSLPIYFATWSKIKAFVYASVSWMVNVLWAIFWLFFLTYFYSDFFIAALFATVAWIMLFVSFHQLLPTASLYKKRHSEVFWVLSWMIVVWFLMLFI